MDGTEMARALRMKAFCERRALHWQGTDLQAEWERRAARWAELLAQAPALRKAA